MSLLSPRRSAGILARRHGRPAAGFGAVAAAAGLAFSPASALAAEAAGAADGPADLEGVIVTAQLATDVNPLNKLPAALKDIPQSVTVIDKSLLQTQGVASLADALRDVPGITIGGAEGGQIGNNINLNGFSARTNLFLDGFRDRAQYYRDTFDLQSVEVLQGPSSMLFGRGSTGGAINQALKRASLTPATEVDLSTTTNGLARGVADVNAPVGEDAAFRVSAMGQDGAASTRTHVTVDDYGLAPTYAWGLRGDTQVTVAGLLQHNDDRPDYGVPSLNGGPVKSGPDAVYGYATDHAIQDIAAASAEVKHAFASGLTLRDQVQYNGVTTNVEETAPHAIGTVGAGGFTALPTAFSTAPLSSLYAELQSHDRLIHDASLYDQLEASGAYTVAGFRNDLLAGIEFGEDHYKNQAFARTGSCNGVALPTGYVGCVSVLNPPYAPSPVQTEVPGNLASGRDDAQAAYLSDTLTLVPQLKLVGGVREDRFDATIGNTINSTNTKGNTAAASLSQTVQYTSVRGGLLYQPSDRQTYYVSYSTAFDPSLEALTSSTGAAVLPPETTQSFEAGGKWDPLKERLDLAGALYRITQDNAFSQNADGTYSPTGTIQVQGVRLSASGKLRPSWSVYGGYTYMDARIIDGVGVGTQGMTPLNTPAHTATIWTTYDVAPSWQIGGGATYLSKRWMNNTDTVSAPGYARIDATLAWRQPRYDIRLNVFNLLGARYYDSVQQSDGGRATPGTGRTAMISLVWRP